MSLSFVFFLASCAGFYKLGVFNTKHPGELAGMLTRFGTRCWQWMHQ